MPQRRPLNPGKIETDQGYEEPMRKAVSVPPQVHEVAKGGGAEQQERNAESNGSQQKGIMDEVGRVPFSRRTQRSRVFHRLRGIGYRVFHVRASLDTMTTGRFSR